jgi:hypothetical protein
MQFPMATVKKNALYNKLINNNCCLFTKLNIFTVYMYTYYYTSLHQRFVSLSMMFRGVTGLNTKSEITLVTHQTH